MGYHRSAIDVVLPLFGTGLSDYEIARRTGVTRAAVQRWRTKGPPVATSSVTTEWRPLDSAAYSYLLGCYLGDGHVSFKPPNGWTLRLACDQKYPGIMDEIEAAIVVLFPPRLPRRHPASSGASDVVSVSHPWVRSAFPQHGAGKKHERLIALEPWQAQLTATHPGALLRGLVHSDGCRVTNSVKTVLPSGRRVEYRYVRYFFTNLSADIRRIFVEHSEMLGVRVTQPSHRNLAISHRDSVAILDRHVGPKT